MSPDFLHNHPQFADLIRIVAEDQGITPALVEKDYWIMQSLYGLQRLHLSFELKGGTSLSKGYGLINRFSEDIDIRIEDRGQTLLAVDDDPMGVLSSNLRGDEHLGHGDVPQDRIHQHHPSAVGPDLAALEVRLQLEAFELAPIPNVRDRVRARIPLHHFSQYPCDLCSPEANPTGCRAPR